MHRLGLGLSKTCFCVHVAARCVRGPCTAGDFDYGGAAFMGPLLQDYNVSAPRELLQVWVATALCLLLNESGLLYVCY